jgi:histidinol-phosphatase (PHP family)
MIRSDFHSHSNFSDGRVSPREMIEAAIAKGLTRYGLSDHAFADYDTDVCIPFERRTLYLSSMRILQDEYAGRIDFKVGLEQDALSGIEEKGCDYIIGSVHYAPDEQGRPWCVENTPEIFLAAVDFAFGGDIYAMVESFWQTESEVVERTNCDIIGHFDICRKFKLFDLNHPRYIAAWQKAADVLLKTGRPFEINMGPVARGYLEYPYPHPDIARYLIDRGAKFVLSSDSHRPDNIAYEFDRWEAYYRTLGADIIEFNC